MQLFSRASLDRKRQIWPAAWCGLNYVSHPMKAVAVLCRIFGALALAGVLLVIAFFVSGEAAVAWYMHHYAITSRLDLSEDYGFGMLSLAVECAAALVALPFALFSGWRLSGRIYAAVVANPLFQRTASGGR